jgi:hypothetical protein
MSENASSEAGEHEPTPETRARVRTLAKVKTAQTRIAKELGIGAGEFKRLYQEDWDAGRDEAQTGLLGKLLAQGMAGNANAAFKYLTLMGMASPKRVEHTGKDGGPIQHVDLTRLSADQLEQYGRLSAIAEGIDPDSILIEHVAPSAP